MSDFYQTGVVATFHKHVRPARGKPSGRDVYQGIRKAAEVFMDDPLGVPLISSWDRVMSAFPDILNWIKEAVEEDNR